MNILKPSIAVKLARIIDAKGLFSYIGQYHYMKLAITSMDEAVVVWCHRVAGGCIQVKALSDQPYFVVTWYGRRLRVLLPQIAPFLERKDEQVKVVLAHLATVVPRGRNGIPPAVQERRQRLCERLAELRLADRSRPT